MGKLALVFAGQGSQYSGMGQDFVEHNTDLLKLEQQANQLLGYRTKDIVFDEHLLNQTRYTQPLLVLTSIYAFETLSKLGITPKGLLGFSLGEYSALYAAGIFTFEEIINLIKKRAEVMDDQANHQQGKMAAILGLDKDRVENLIIDINDLVYVANYNSPLQTVISGSEHAVDLALEKAKQLGAKRAVKLNVSGAFHSPLMKDASLIFKEYLDVFQPKQPGIDVYLNTTAKPLTINQLKNEMINQMVLPVRFVESILQMKKDGFTHFIEVGPGTVLSGLIKKIDMDLEVTHIGNLTDIENVKGWLIEHGFIK
ncbi:MAG: ACP S-malonyltransferase [Acholeplasmataceae bacterium]